MLEVVPYILLRLLTVEVDILRFITSISRSMTLTDILVTHVSAALSLTKRLTFGSNVGREQRNSEMRYQPVGGAMQFPASHLVVGKKTTISTERYSIRYEGI